MLRPEHILHKSLLWKEVSELTCVGCRAEAHSALSCALVGARMLPYRDLQGSTVTQYCIDTIINITITIMGNWTVPAVPASGFANTHTNGRT